MIYLLLTNSKAFRPHKVNLGLFTKSIHDSGIKSFGKQSNAFTKEMFLSIDPACIIHMCERLPTTIQGNNFNPFVSVI
jgi:hypothetical protein